MTFKLLLVGWCSASLLAGGGLVVWFAVELKLLATWWAARRARRNACVLPTARWLGRRVAPWPRGGVEISWPRHRCVTSFGEAPGRSVDMSCPKCGSSQTRYVPPHEVNATSERLHKAHLARELGNAPKHPATALIAVGLAGAAKLGEMWRHDWACEACRHTWRSARDGSEADREHWWQLWRKKPEAESYLSAIPDLANLDRFTSSARSIIRGAEHMAAKTFCAVQAHHLLVSLLDHYSEPAGHDRRTVECVWVVESLLALDRPEALGLFRRELERRWPPVPPVIESTVYPRAPREPVVDRILATAVHEAEAMGMRTVGTGHIVLGMISAGEAAGAVLHHMGLQPPVLRQKLVAHAVERR